MLDPSRLIAVDVGNARIKLGLFAFGAGAVATEPLDVLPLPDELPAWDRIELWLTGSGVAQTGLAWWIASVNRPSATRLIEWLRIHRPADSAVSLTFDDMPLAVRLARPDAVGIDRLVDAVAVNRFRRPGRPAVIVDVGTAITADLISADGAFLGGAILPGPGMSARALHEFTDLLPLVDVRGFGEPPAALGTATGPAIASGIFWGALGAIRELVDRLRKTAGNADADVFLTGGDGAAVAKLLGSGCRYLPHLTLSGIALAAEKLLGKREEPPCR